VTDTRPLRVDAQRNRDRLLEVAAQSFAHDGPQVSLDAVAKQAGVGIGTLYRHFPTREALIEAAYRQELAKLCDAVPGLLDAMPADRALRTWMDLFAEYMAAKRGMADALRTVIASGGDPYAHSREALLGAITTLLAAAAAAGTVRDDVAPVDVLVSLGGMAAATADPDRSEQTARLLDLLMDGLRYRPR
jgi:AcrR family transcriptional regulator